MPAFKIIGFIFSCKFLTHGSAARLHHFTWAAQDYRRQVGCNDIRITFRHAETSNIAYCKVSDLIVHGPFLALTPSLEFTRSQIRGFWRIKMLQMGFVNIIWTICCLLKPFLGKFFFRGCPPGPQNIDGTKKKNSENLSPLQTSFWHIFRHKNG